MNKDEHSKKPNRFIKEDSPSNRIKEKQMQAMNKQMMISRTTPNAVPQTRRRYHTPL